MSSCCTALANFAFNSQNVLIVEHGGVDAVETVMQRNDM